MKARKELFEKTVRLVSEHPAFSGAKEAAIRYVLASDDVLLREIPKGQQIFPCYGVKKAVGIILTGGCHICRGKKIVQTKSDGYVFGVQTLYSLAEEDFQLTAAQDSKVVFMKKSAVDWLLQDDFSAAKSYIEFLSDEINGLSGKAAVLESTSAENKLAQYLLSRARNSANEVSLPQDMLKLAKQLGLGKDGLYRAIDKLNSLGAIGFSGSAVCIKDEEKLKEFAK